MPDRTSRPRGAGSEPARADSDSVSVSVLRTFGPLATKRITYNPPTGSYSFQDYGRAALFSISEHPVSSIHELAAMLAQIGKDPQCFIVRGAIIDGTDRKRAQRRLLPRRNKTTGQMEPATLEHADRHWLLLDVDGIPCPESIDPIHEPDAVVEHVVGLLPPAFQGATCWWQFTSGHGIKPGIRLRLGFWSSRKVGTEYLKTWLGEMVDANDGNLVKRWPVDCSVFVPSQPNYVAKPVFEGCHDPVPLRSGIWLGDSDEVDPPEIDMSRPVMLAGTTPGIAGLGYDSYRALIGDHSGMGFYDPIKKAVAAYMRRNGAGVDTSWLRDDLDAAIRERGHTRSPQYVEDRVRDLDGLIDRIREYQAADEARKASEDAARPPVLPRGAMPGVRPYWSTVPMSVDEGRAALSTAIREAGHLAAKVTPGGGKSTSEGELSIQIDGWTLYLFPNHEAAGPFVEELHDKGGVAIHLTGRGYEDAKGLICAENALAEMAHRLHLNIREDICRFCPSSRGCRYLMLLAQIEAALATHPTGVLVGVHNYFSQSMAREVDTSKIVRVVVDERIDLGSDLPIPLDRLEDEMADIFTAKAIKAAFNSEGWLDLGGFNADELEQRAEVEGRSDKLKLDPSWSWEQRVEAIRRHTERRGNDLRWKFKKMLETMAWEVREGRRFSNQVVLVRDEPQRDGSRRAIVHVYGKKEIAEKLAGLDVHYLDGTMDEMHARVLLGPDSRFVSVDIARNLHVTQVTDVTFSKNYMLHRSEAEENRRRFYGFLEGLGRKHAKILVGLPKKCRDVMEAEWAVVSGAMASPPQLVFAHFNKARSNNSFKTFDAVVIVGREEPGARTVEALARQLRPDTPITPIAPTEKDGGHGPQWPRRGQGFTMRDGSLIGVEVPYHPCPICQSVLQQIREGEIVQLVDRLRSVNRSERTFAYLLTDIPTELVVDRIAAWRDLLAETCEFHWWQRALSAGQGVAPFTPEWLVAAGIFGTFDAARKAVARFTEKRGHPPYKNLSYMAGVPLIRAYRRMGQRGRESAVLVASNIENAAGILTSHVGPLRSYDGVDVPTLAPTSGVEQPHDATVVAQPEPGAVEPDFQRLLAAYGREAVVNRWPMVEPEAAEILDRRPMIWRVSSKLTYVGRTGVPL
jgi:hypothetical protein